MSHRPPHLSDQRGFTLAAAMGIMLIASIVCLAAFQAAGGDLVPSTENSSRKTAYAAAESGISWYLSKLGSNPDYWQQCDTGKTNGVDDPVNQPTATAAQRRWKKVTGTGTDAPDFNITLLPTGSTCDTSSDTSMISTTTGAFRIRSTGRFRGQKRSVITSFRRQRFLDYIYFTDYETLDPSVTGSSSGCKAYRAARPASCSVIQFAGNDKVNGPLHTNDDLIYCGTPIFGRDAQDNIHVSGPSPGYAKNPSAGCTDTGTPNFKGTFRYGQRQLQMPPSNSDLKDLTTVGTSGQGYLLTGTQYIRFLGNGQMVIDTPTTNPVTVPVPPNGVVYVANGACTPAGDPAKTTYGDSAGCGNAYVSGPVNKSVTITAEKDIIVAPTETAASNAFNPATPSTAWSDANLTVSGGSYNAATHQLTSGVQIGLIAQNFVRVYHPVGSFPTSNLASAALTSGVRDVRIDAAILSLEHSYIVDNWAYGPGPGTLTVNGAIAQSFRGPVGTGSGATISTGYIKDYWYDNRLRYRSPPHFLNPVDAAWGVGRQSELVPPV